MTQSMDKTVAFKGKISEAPSDAEYWRSRPPEERLAAVEELRRDFHGPHYDSEQRLQRVVRIVVRKDQ